MNLLTPALASLGGVVLFVCTGWGVARFVPMLRRMGVLRRLGYVYLLGVATLSAAAWTASHVLGLPLRRGVLLVPAILAVAAGVGRAWVRRREEASVVDVERAARSRFDRMLSAAAALAVCTITAGLFAGSLTEICSDGDAQMTWSAAASFIRGERTVDAEILRDGRDYVTHPRYPILMPLAQVIVHEVFDTDGDDRAIGGIYAAFFPAFLLVLYDHARRLAGLRAACLTVLTAALIPLPGLFNANSGGANSAYSDFPLACFWGAGLLLLLRPGADAKVGACAGVLLGAGLLTKNEGLPLAAIALGVTCLAALTTNRRRRPAARARALPLPRALLPFFSALLAPALAVALLVSWRARIPNRFDEGYAISGPLALARAMIDRLPQLPKPMWQEMAKSETWGGFWFVAPLVLLAGAPALARRPARCLVLALAGGLTVYLLAYSITPWEGTLLVQPTWFRFLLQLSLPGLVVLSMCLRAVFPRAADRGRRRE